MATASDKSERYDRQLRLWANDGQSRLERSHICLINATPTGAEALKNLILPGIGAFTIVDERVVNEEDLSGNFFLTEDDIGLKIAYQMSRLLLELNPDVVYRAVPESIEDCLLNPAFFDEFDIVLVSDYIPLSDMLVLKQRLWNKNVPLLHVNSCGLYGTLQIFCEETTIVETHDPSQLYDLRIDQPWPELQQYVDSFNLDTLDDTDHAHVPYIVIFIKGLQNWKKDHGGCPPKNYAEKRIFKAEYIESLSRNINLEANFLEASLQIHRALQETVVPNYLKELFEDERISDENLSEETPLFWMFVKALAYFVEYEGALPLPGSLPDMVSSTSNYITLQQLYRNKALKDQGKFAELLQLLLSKVGKAEDVPIDLVASFCKNSAFLYFSRGSSAAFSNELKNKLLFPEEKFNTLAIHYGIHALHSWITRGSPNSFSGYLESFSHTLAIFDLQCLPENCKKVLHEVYQHHTKNFHGTCSLMGGIASQEILKIATAQYTPLDNLVIFDGINTISEKWKP